MCTTTPGPSLARPCSTAAKLWRRYVPAGELSVRRGRVSRAPQPASLRRTGMLIAVHKTSIVEVEAVRVCPQAARILTHRVRRRDMEAVAAVLFSFAAHLVIPVDECAVRVVSPR